MLSEKYYQINVQKIKLNVESELYVERFSLIAEANTTK